MDSFVWDEHGPEFDVPDGEYKVKILKVYDGQNKNAKNFTGFLLEVEGSDMAYIWNIWYGNDFVNRNWTNFLSAFKITPPPLNEDWKYYYDMWKGLEARAMFRHKDDEYLDRNGIKKTSHRCELHYFVTTPKQDGQNAAPESAAVPAAPAKPAMPAPFSGVKGMAQAALQPDPGEEEFPEDLIM